MKTSNGDFVISGVSREGTLTGSFQPLSQQWERGVSFPNLSGQKYNARGLGLRQYSGTATLPAWVRVLERKLSVSAPDERV
jgi:hypothetical protein